MPEDITIKYPDEIASQVRNKTFSIRGALSLIQADKSPMLLHAGYSKFICTIIDKQNGRKVFPCANIPVDECARIFKRTDVAVNKIVDYEMMKAVNQGTSVRTQDVTNRPSNLAYTLVLKLGNADIKGKTPADILMADSSKRDVLINQSKWLKDTVAKDPESHYAKDNIAQANAIDEAIKLLDRGELVSGMGLGAQSEPAYTTVLKIGSADIKGKIPADILLLDPTKKDVLVSQSKWLKNAVAKDPESHYAKDNIAQANAIDQAIKLFSNGELKARSKDFNNELTNLAPTNGSILIYDAQMRPLKSKKRSDGLWFVYGINITCNVGNDYPFAVTIVNYYAPIVIKPNGQYNVKVKEMDTSSYVKTEMKLSEKEWIYDTAQMQAALRIFERKYGIHMFDKAIAEIDKNRKNAKYNEIA